MKHPEDNHFQEEFIEDVKKLKKEIHDKGNPFLESGDKLFTLDTHDIMPPEVIQSLKECDTIGLSAHDEYVQKRIIECSQPVSDTIHKQNIFTFENRK